MLWSSVICIIGEVLQACSQNIGMFVGGRVIIGFGCGLAVVGGSSYLAEVVSVRKRAFGECPYPSSSHVFPRPSAASVDTNIIMSTVLGLFWDAWWAGALIAAGIAFGTKSILSTWAWRLPSILQVIPSLLCIAILPFIPESPRWCVMYIYQCLPSAANIR
jgi:MFS family permease